MIRIRIYKKSRAIKAARAAIENHLYVDPVYWCLYTYLDGIARQNRKNDIVVLALEEEIPVGVLAFRAIAPNTFYVHDGSIMTFVKETHRMKGIGRQLVSKFKQHKVKPFFFERGMLGSDIFYNKTVHEQAYPEHYSFQLSTL